MKQILSFLTLWCTLSALAQEDKPLMTIACLSDSHAEFGMVTPSDPMKVRLRNCFAQTLKKIGETEQIDVMLLGGDYTNDADVPEANWQRLRTLMAEATTAAFPADKTYRPVIYGIGNHDYEVANYTGFPRAYNASDYYTFPMKDQVGPLADDECYYEDVDNGSAGTMRVLVAYHYNIGGLDFVVHGGGGHLFAKTNDYRITLESAQWVARKLAQIDPEGCKTIIYLNHIPLPGTIGSRGNHVLVPGDATYTLLAELQKHPGLLYLYGHDHGSQVNDSYITHHLSQRLTPYTLSGDLLGTPFRTLLRSATNSQKYLGTNGNLNPVSRDQAHIFTLTTRQSPFAPDTTVTTLCLKSQGKGYVHSNYSGVFSFDIYTNRSQEFFAYEIDDLRKGHPTTQFQWGKKYAFLCHNTKGDWVAMKNTATSATGTDARMARLKFATLPPDGTLFDSSTHWILEQPDTLEAVSTLPSFTSCFMGSMRYNSLDTNAGPRELDPAIYQALIIKVYPDYLLLEMKNYGQTGDLSGKAVTTHVEPLLTPSTLSRPDSPATVVQDTPLQLPASPDAPTKILRARRILIQHAGRIYTTDGKALE